MSDNVNIYVKYSADPQGLVHRIGEELGALGYFASATGYLIPIRTQPWIGIDDLAHVDVDPTDLGRKGDPGLAAGTAFAPYEFDLAITFGGGPAGHQRESLDRLGFELFTRLTQLGLPMAYGGRGAIFADYLPDRGSRVMPPGTDEENDRDAWFEPRLHTRPEQPWPADVAPLDRRPIGPTLVYETAGLLQMATLVPESGGSRWIIPSPKARVDMAPEEIGLLLAHAQRPTAAATAIPAVAALTDFAGWSRVPVADFLPRSVSVEVRPEGPGLLVQAHRVPANGELVGPVVPELSRLVPPEASPGQLGQLLVDLFAAPGIR
jgi:hypothetical protein